MKFSKKALLEKRAQKQSKNLAKAKLKTDALLKIKGGGSIGANNRYAD